MRIYFSGIGGVGIGPLAEIAHDAGYDVIGSDPTQSLMTHELEARGITVSSDQTGAFLQQTHGETPLDWFVYTAALPQNHPELLLARQLGIRIAKRDELLAHIITEKNLKLIAVAGTHGKTTTTGMMIWALQKLGLPVSYSIGTTIGWGASGKFDSDSTYFVYECDEFDRNFLHFSPYVSLLTSVEHDHPDTYPTEDEYYDAFSEFAANSHQVICWQADAMHLKLPEHSWVLRNHEVLPVSLAGEHNRRNATLVAKACEYLSLDIDVAILESFPGTDRRFEKLADNLYTDYGHTPTEIAATLQLAHELSDTVILVYQPHQNIRQHAIRDQYTDTIFADAHKVYWLPTYMSREDPQLAVLTPDELMTRLNTTTAVAAEFNPELWGDIETHRQAGHLVLLMGAGAIDGWARTNLSTS